MLDIQKEKGDSKSTTGYTKFVGDNLVTRSKKQDVPQSSNKTKYQGMTHPTWKLLCLKNLLKTLLSLISSQRALCSCIGILNHSSTLFKI